MASYFLSLGSDLGFPVPPVICPHCQSSAGEPRAWGCAYIHSPSPTHAWELLLACCQTSLQCTRSCVFCPSAEYEGSWKHSKISQGSLGCKWQEPTQNSLSPWNVLDCRWKARKGSHLRHSKIHHEWALSAPLLSLCCSAFFLPAVFCIDLERWAFLVYVVLKLWSKSKEKMLSSLIILLRSPHCGDP